MTKDDASQEPQRQDLLKVLVDTLQNVTDGLIRDVLDNHLPQLKSDLERGVTSEHQAMTILDHLIRARSYQEAARRLVDSCVPHPAPHHTLPDPITVIVNGRKVVSPYKVLTYAGVVQLAFRYDLEVIRKQPEGGYFYTVTYHGAGGDKADGCLAPDQILVLKEGTVINVADTGAA